MDYKDLQTGQTKENFWFKAKNDLVKVLMQKICENKNQLKILNIGAGTGDDLKILKIFGENYVTDIDENALSIIDDKLCKEKNAQMPATCPTKIIFLIL